MLSVCICVFIIAFRRPDPTAVELGGGTQSGTIHAIAANWRISQANQSRNNFSLAASQDVNQNTNHLKDMYINVCSLKNKQEELELYSQSESYDNVGVTETW